LTTWNKECSEPENDIIEQVVEKDVVLDLFGTLVHVLVVNLHLIQSILAPVVREMTVNLVDEHGREWFTRESGKKEGPIVEIGAVTVIAHSLVVVLNNLNERTHDLRETNDTNEHVADTDQDLVYRNRVVVTITNSGQRGQGKVANNNDLSENVRFTIYFVPRFVIFDYCSSVLARVIFRSLIRIAVRSVTLIRHAINKHLVKFVRRDKRVLLLNIIVGIDVFHEEPPEASNNIRDHKDNNDESENLVRVHHHVLSLDTVSTRGLIVVRFNETFNSTNIKQLDQFRQPRQSNQPCILTVTEHEIKRKSGDEIEEHPARFEVPDGKQFVASDASERFFVLILLEKVKEEIECEANEDKVVDKAEDRSSFNVEGNVKHSSETRVANNKQNRRVECRLPLTVHADNEVFGLHDVAKRASTAFVRYLVLI
jgi:hypothetical protein